MKLRRILLFLLILPICSSQAGCTTVSQTCDKRMEAEMHEKCGAYTFLRMKPLFLKVEDLKSTIEANTIEIRNKNNQISTLQSDIKLKDETIEQTNDQKETLESKVNIGMQTIKEKDELVNQLKDQYLLFTKGKEIELKALRDQVFTLNRDNSRKIKENDYLVDRLKTEIQILEARVSNDQQLINTLQMKSNSIQSLESTINQLTDQLNSEVALRNDDNRECQKMRKRYPNSCESNEKSSIQSIVPTNPIRVLCDSDWIVIQQRVDDSEDFERSLNSYKHGFGDLTANFFIGLENLFKLTTERKHELYIHLKDFNNNVHYARYDNFVIDSETEGYALKTLGIYTGTAGDSMERNEGHSFSTFDDDNHNNCACRRKGGWWYSNHCGDSNLNGLYNIRGKKGIFWRSLDDYDYTYKFVQMKIRQKA